MAMPALMSKKLKRPVMMRISRAEEYYIGHARNGFQGRVKLGFGADGRLLAADLYIVQESGAYNGFWDFRNAADALSVVYQPESMRWRGIPVYTNSPTRSAQRGPGENQIACILEPLMDRAARDLKIDRLQIRKHQCTADRLERRREPPATSRALTCARRCAGREALQLGGARGTQRPAARLEGDAARHRPGLSPRRLQRLRRPGAHHARRASCTSTPGSAIWARSPIPARRASPPRYCKYDWDDCVVERGDTRSHLPWNIGQFGSNTSFTMARTNYVAAMDALEKMQAIAAQDLGGKPGDYEVDGKKIFASAQPARHLTYAQLAQRAIALGGKFCGHELPDDINPMTRASAAALAGSGLIGVAKDTLPVAGETAAFACAFVEIELDLETGQHRVSRS